MSTIFAWNDAAALTALETSSGDYVFLGDISAGSSDNPVTKRATLYDIGQQGAILPVATNSSNGAAIAGTFSGVTNLGTSTAVVLSAPQKAGLVKLFTSNTSTVSYTVTASGSSFGTGSVLTALGGGQAGFVAVSTSRWVIDRRYAMGSTDLA